MQCSVDGTVGHVHDVDAAHGDSQRLGLQTPPTARLTGSSRHVSLNLRANVVGLCFTIPARHVVDDALERGVPLVGLAFAGVVLHLDGLSLGAVENYVHVLLFELFERCIGREIVRSRDRFKLAVVPGRDAARPRPRLDRSLGKAELFVRYYQVWVYLQLVTQTGARGTRSVGIVEAECSRLHLAQADVAVHARELLGEQQLLVVDHIDQHDAVGHPQCCLDRVGDASGLGAAANDQPVDDDLDGMPLFLVQVEGLGQIVSISIDPHAHEPGLAGSLEHLFVLALTPSHHRRQDLDAAVLCQRQNCIDDLLHGLPFDGSPALVAVGVAHPGVQQAKVVVNLGDGADCRAGVVRHTLLVDGYRRGQPFDVIHVGLVHAPKELPSICRKRFDVSPLALGVDRVEGKGAFPRARHAGHYHQLVARYGDVDVLEVVFAGTPNDDVL